MTFFTADDDESGYDKATYACHLVAICLEICAYSSLAVLWSSTLMSRNNARHCVIPFVASVDAVFVVYVLYLIVDMVFVNSSTSFYDWASASDSFTGILVIEPFVLLVLAAIIGYLGIQITRRLVAHPSWALLSPSDKHAILTQFLGTVVVICGSLLLRGLFEVDLFFFEAQGIDDEVWWICSGWIPTILPALAILYTLRKSDAKNPSFSVSVDDAPIKWVHDGASQTADASDRLLSEGGFHEHMSFFQGAPELRHSLYAQSK